MTTDMTSPDTDAGPMASSADGANGSMAVALLRITLGVIILVTWWGNVGNDFYTADGIEGFINWLFTAEEEGGNGSSLGFFQSILDATVVPAAGVVGFVQLIIEGLMGLGLLVGGMTRLASLGAMGFFAILFLSYFGGGEWIWTYVLLFMAALTVFMGWGGRVLGLDQAIAKARGASPAGLLW